MPEKYSHGLIQSFILIQQWSEMFSFSPSIHSIYGIFLARHFYLAAIWGLYPSYMSHSLSLSPYINKIIMSSVSRIIIIILNIILLYISLLCTLLVWLWCMLPCMYWENPFTLSFTVTWEKMRRTKKKKKLTTHYTIRNSTVYALMQTTSSVLLINFIKLLCSRCSLCISLLVLLCLAPRIDRRR